MLVIADFAQVMKNSLGFGAFATTSETTGLADAIISHLGTSGIVTHASGTVTGLCPAGSPLQNGAATGGVISGLVPATLASLMQVKMGKPNVSSQLSGFATAFTTHLMTGLVNFAAGDITGDCTNSSESPGILANGAGTGGTITALDGSAFALLIASGLGQPNVSSELQQFADDVVSYIQDNAEVTYSAGSVTGIAPSGGGPLSAGAGAGGQIA